MRGMKSVRIPVFCSQLPGVTPIVEEGSQEKLPDWLQDSDDFDQVVPDANPLIAEWLLEGELGLLQGEPGGGKSWLALDMALAVARGRPFMGKYPTRQGKVIVVEQEGLASDLRNRIRRLGGPCGRNLLVSFRKGVRIDEQSWVGMIVEMVKRFDIALIVADPLADLHECDENDASSMRAVTHFVQEVWLRSPSTATMFVSHVTKDGFNSRKGSLRHGRGSGRLAGSADVVLECLKRKPNDPEDEVCMVLEMVKRKSAPANQPLRITLSLAQDGEAEWTVSGQPSTSNSSLSSLEKQCLGVIRRGDPIVSKNEMVKAIHQKRESVLDAMDSLLDSGRIIIGPGGIFHEVVPGGSQRFPEPG